MSELGTRDVLEQGDARLDNIEQDLRALRTEMNSRFERVYQELRDLRSSVDHRFTWLYGLLVVVLLGVAGLWFK